MKLHEFPQLVILCLLIMSGCSKESINKDTSDNLDKNIPTITREFNTLKEAQVFYGSQKKLLNKQIVVEVITPSLPKSSTLDSFKPNGKMSLSVRKRSDVVDQNSEYYDAGEGWKSLRFEFPNLKDSFPYIVLVDLWVSSSGSTLGLLELTFGGQILPGINQTVEARNKSIAGGSYYSIRGDFMYRESLTVAGVVVYTRVWRAELEITRKSDSPSLINAKIVYTEIK